MTIEEFMEFADEYPELAQCVCLDEVEVYLEEECN
jgi:hypothetical protein